MVMTELNLNSHGQAQTDASFEQLQSSEGVPKTNVYNSSSLDLIDTINLRISSHLFIYIEALRSKKRRAHFFLDRTASYISYASSAHGAGYACRIVGPTYWPKWGWDLGDLKIWVGPSSQQKI
eukprot:TRINITY_DN8839_c1_g1_i1.p1 TRINITY_DN8839_c1_g1~~TRINITY_DN8839_c1_g1_i1.p1  ORF type:complete len:123 (-),score=11.71 TRINITY_DN8839_c1_g1_i1:82-450(-)